MARRLTLLGILMKACKDAFGNRAPFSSERVNLYFCVCRMCRRVAPMWQYLNLKKGDRRGCLCGHGDFSPANLPQWKAMWWFIIRGWLIRGFIMGRRNWDPRMPEQQETVVV